MSWLNRHQHEWGPWRFTLVRLTDSPYAEPPTQARHCSTCHRVEFRPVQPDTEPSET